MKLEGWPRAEERAFYSRFTTLYDLGDLEVVLEQRLTQMVGEDVIRFVHEELRESEHNIVDQIREALGLQDSVSHTSDVEPVLDAIFGEL